MVIDQKRINNLKLDNTEISKDLSKVAKKVRVLTRNLAKYKIAKNILGSQQKKLVKDIYIAEGKVTILPMRKKRTSNQSIRAEKTMVEKTIEELPTSLQSEMLARLLAIRAERDRQKLQIGK